LRRRTARYSNWLRNVVAHHHRPVSRKAIGRLIGLVHDHLECVRRLRLLLEVRQRSRKVRVAELRLDEEPGLAVADDEKVHLALLLVLHVAQFKVAEPEISPAFDRLQQVAGHERLRPRDLVVDPAPIAEEPLLPVTRLRVLPPYVSKKRYSR
jgi:hypothetical protein